MEENTKDKQKSPSEVAVNVRREIQSDRRVKRIVKQRRPDKRGRQKEESEFDRKIINIRRVTRVYKGGKRMRLSVFLVAGDRRGRVGLGIGKGADVKTAEEKAFNQALKHLQMVKLKGRTIPHEVKHKYGASKVLLKPAAPGTGIIAGSSVRLVVEMAGIKDILTKQLGGGNSIGNAYATFEALLSLRTSRL